MLGLWVQEHSSCSNACRQPLHHAQPHELVLIVQQAVSDSVIYTEFHLPDRLQVYLGSME